MRRGGASVVPSVALGLLAWCASGCVEGVAGREVEPGSDAPGLRYYLPTPLLVVRQLDDDRWDADLQLVVDRRHEFTVQPWAVLARGDATVRFASDGTLERFQLEQDHTEVPAAVVGALKDLKLRDLQLREQLLRDRARDVRAGAARMADVLSGTRPTRPRAVYAAVVRGGTLEGWDGHPLATVELPPDLRARLPDPDAADGPAAGALSATVRGDELVLAVADAPLAAADIEALRFWTATDEITASDALRPLRAALRARDGQLVGAAAPFRAAGVVRVGFGDVLQAPLRTAR